MKTCINFKSILFFALTVLALSSCNKNNEQVTPTDEPQQTALNVPALSEAKGPIINFTEPAASPNGRVAAEIQMTRVNGRVLSAGGWQNVFTTANAGWDLSATYKGQIYNYGGGSVDLYVYNNINNNWVYIGGTSGSGNPKSFTFTMKAGQQHYFWAYCSAGSNVRFDAALYKITNDSGSGTGTATISATFPATSITSKSSTSAYATSLNAFNGYNGQCTWYVYARIQELVASGYLSQATGTAIKNAFWGKSNRHAKNWPSFIGGTWYNTNTAVLPTNMRKKGLIVVWAAGTYGHVGFVESVSADKKRYVVSEFNFYSDEKYRTKEYYFDGGSDKVLGTFPRFYELGVIK
jgi:surface antigen